jgi:hypothetical protein
MKHSNKRPLSQLTAIRRRLEKAFHPDTAAPGNARIYTAHSAGHCEAVAIILQRLFGGDMKSAQVFGVSHWYNHIDGHDIDLTADQFGLPLVLGGRSVDSTVYNDPRIRLVEQLTPETLERAHKLATRAGFGGIFQTTSLAVRPTTLKAAMALNFETHRRLPRLQGGMWAVACADAEGIKGAAIVGRPTARLLDNGARLQVLRCAVKEGTPNGCSILYTAVARAARAMGTTDCFTYIHDDEHGASLKASGWVEDTSFKSDGGEWNRPSRKRSATVEPGAKKRWFAGWSEMLKKVSK